MSLFYIHPALPLSPSLGSVEEPLTLLTVTVITLSNVGPLAVLNEAFHQRIRGPVPQTRMPSAFNSDTPVCPTTSQPFPLCSDKLPHTHTVSETNGDFSFSPGGDVVVDEGRSLSHQCGQRQTCFGFSLVCFSVVSTLLLLNR